MALSRMQGRSTLYETDLELGPLSPPARPTATPSMAASSLGPTAFPHLSSLNPDADVVAQTDFSVGGQALASPVSASAALASLPRPIAGRATLDARQANANPPSSSSPDASMGHSEGVCVCVCVCVCVRVCVRVCVYV